MESTLPQNESEGNMAAMMAMLSQTINTMCHIYVRYKQNITVSGHLKFNVDENKCFYVDVNESTHVRRHVNSSDSKISVVTGELSSKDELFTSSLIMPATNNTTSHTGYETDVKAEDSVIADDTNPNVPLSITSDSDNAPGKPTMNTRNKMRQTRTVCRNCHETYPKESVHKCQQISRQTITDTVYRMKVHPCPICNKVFQSANIKRRHVRQLHEGETHICSVCERVFNSKSSMQRHTRLVHAKPGKGEMVLNIERLNTIENVKSTMPGKMNEGSVKEKLDSEKANDGTSKTYKKTRPKISNKKLNGGKKKRIQCTTCGKLFTDVFIMRRHERQIHQGEQHTCSVCGRVFNQKESMMRHLRTVHANLQKVHANQVDESPEKKTFIKIQVFKSPEKIELDPIFMNQDESDVPNTCESPHWDPQWPDSHEQTNINDHSMENVYVNIDGSEVANNNVMEILINEEVENGDPNVVNKVDLEGDHNEVVP